MITRLNVIEWDLTQWFCIVNRWFWVRKSNFEIFFEFWNLKHEILTRFDVDIDDENFEYFSF